MNDYVLTLLVKNEISEANRRTLLDGFVKKFAKMTKEDLWGSKNLAYPINHADKAFYAHYEFQSEPKAIPELDRSIRLHEDIIRYLLVKKS